MSRKHIGVIIGLAVVVAVAGIAGATMSRAGEASAAASDGAPPTWLVAATENAVNGCASQTTSTDAAVSGAATAGLPATATWSLTTVGAYRDSLAEPSTTTANADKPLYVVTVDGSFVAPHSRPGSPPPTGTQLLLVFDPETHALSILGVLISPIDEGALGAVQTMAL